MSPDDSNDSGTLWDKINLDDIEGDGRPPPVKSDTDLYTPSTDRHDSAPTSGSKTGRIQGDFSLDEDEEEVVVAPRAHTDTYAPGEPAPQLTAPPDPTRPRTESFAGDELRMRTDVFQKYVSGQEEEEEEELSDAPFHSPAWDINEETMEPDIDRPATDMFYHERESSRHERSTQEAPANLIKEIRLAFEIGGAKGGWRKYLELGGTYNPWILPEEMLIGFIRMHYGRKDWESLRPCINQMIKGYPASANQAKLLKVVDVIENRGDLEKAKRMLTELSRDKLDLEAHRIQWDRLQARIQTKQAEANPSWLD